MHVSGYPCPRAHTLLGVGGAQQHALEGEFGEQSWRGGSHPRCSHRHQGIEGQGAPFLWGQQIEGSALLWVRAWIRASFNGLTVKLTWGMWLALSLGFRSFPESNRNPSAVSNAVLTLESLCAQIV